MRQVPRNRLAKEAARRLAAFTAVDGVVDRIDKQRDGLQASGLLSIAASAAACPSQFIITARATTVRLTCVSVKAGRERTKD